MKAILFLFLATVAAYAQPRTWTFAQDGKSDPQLGALSFRKGGRIDAQFVKMSGTNAVVLNMAGQKYLIALTNFSAGDRAYVAQVKGMPVDEAALAREAQNQRIAAMQRLRAQQEVESESLKQQGVEARAWRKYRKAEEIRGVQDRIVTLERDIAEVHELTDRNERRARQTEINLNRNLLAELRTKLLKLQLEYEKMP
jgi:hypothetical protein